MTELRNIKKWKGSNCWKIKKGEVHLWKRWHRTHNSREKHKDGRENSERERKKGGRQTCLSLLSLWYDKFMHSSCVCQSRKARGVCWTISQGGEEGGRKRGRKKKREREGKKERGRKRAETLSSNSRKWVDRGRLCSLCGFNESTVFRTLRGTRELA